MRGAIVFVLLLCSQASANQLYQRYTYYHCGKAYYGYRAYHAAPLAPQYHTQNVSYTYNLYGQQAARQGDTQYGVTDIADFYGDVDLGAAFHQAGRLAEGAQRLTEKATLGFTSMVETTSSDRTRVALALAQGQAAAQALSAAKPAPSATIVRHVQGEQHVEVPVAAGGNLDATNRACAECHGAAAETKGGGNHLPKLQDLSAEQAKIAREYITRLDENNCARKARLSHEAQQELLELLCKKSNQ